MSFFLAYSFNKATFLEPQPITQLERDVDALLIAAKMREEDIPETEDAMLKMNDLSVEEIAERRDELRKMRELMFRAEIKSRRVKKIKSKTYRRLRRKEKERLDEKINGKTTEEGSETDRLQREMERAKERATLRHKHTGKWAKHMRNRGDLDDGTRQDLEDMLARGDRLRRRIQGIASGESEGENGDESGDDDDDELEGEEGIAKVKQDAFSELAQLESGDTIQSKDKGGRSVFEMKFMKEAMARKASVVDKEVDDFIKELSGDVGHDSEEAANDAEEVPSGGVVAVRSGGRVVYRPVATPPVCNKDHIICSLLTMCRRPAIYQKPTRMLHQTPQALPSNQRISFHLRHHLQSVTPCLRPCLLSKKQTLGSFGTKSCCQEASEPRTASLLAKTAKRYKRPNIS